VKQELSRSEKELQDYPETTIKVGPDGFVRLMDHMGSDEDIYDSARVSFNLKDAPRKDVRSLIRRLVRHKHTTPIEMVELKFFIRMPIDTARQHIRHRTASTNERSTRYIDVPVEDAHLNPPEAWRGQSSSAKQGSAGPVDFSIGATASIFERSVLDAAMSGYKALQDLGVAKEQARKVLTLSTYTEFVWKIDLHNLMHYLGLRLALDAQSEIRQYAGAMEKLIEGIVPLSMEAFRDFRLNAVTFSDLEMKALRVMLKNRNKPVRKVSEAMGVFGRATKGEIEEFEAKWKLLSDD
jgi:thymidylate synthase (FAD)